jgi:hypothetical protein
MADYFDSLEVLSMLESLRASFYQHRRDIISVIALTIFGVLIFLPMMQRFSSTGDYPQHNQLALDLLANPTEFLRNTPHFLYHIATAAVYLLLGDISLAGAWVMVLCYIIVMWLIYWQLRCASEFLGSFWLILLTIGITLSLALFMPINIFTPENLYFGYFAPNVYHNPTIIIMKPFALLLFFLSLRLFGQEKPLSRWWIIPFALLSFLSMIAKPSFIIAFVPALGLLCCFFLLYRFRDTLSLLLNPMNILWGFLGIENSKELPVLMRRSFINWPVLLGGIVLPSLLVLYIQTLTWTSSGGIGIEPFRVIFEWTLHYEKNADQLLFFKLIMSCAFPLLVYVLYLRHSYRNLGFNLAWLLFAVSVSYAYLFIDYSGIAAGDFGWSAQIAVFILHAVAAVFLLQVTLKECQKTSLDWLTLGLCLVVFSLHLISGIHWYNLHLHRSMEDLLYIWW